MRVLVVEDEPLLAEGIRDGLRLEAIAADVALDGHTALELLSVNDYDVAVIDRDIPGPSGDEVARGIVGSGSGLPILMLTAADRLEDKASGFELGADDYLTKPFSILELQARVKAILRRVERRSAGAPGAPDPDRITIGELEIDVAAREARVCGHPVSLTAREFELLLHFARNPGRAFTRTQLLDAVWGTSFEGYEHNVNTHINRLRSKIEIDPANPRYVLTVRGVGYRFADPRAEPR